MILKAETLQSLNRVMDKHYPILHRQYYKEVRHHHHYDTTSLLRLLLLLLLLPLSPYIHLLIPRFFSLCLCVCVFYDNLVVVVGVVSFV